MKTRAGMRGDSEVETQTVSPGACKARNFGAPVSQQNGEAVLVWGGALKWNRGEEGRVGPESGSAGPSVYHVSRQEESLHRTHTLPAAHSINLPQSRPPSPHFRAATTTHGSSL